MSFDRLYLFVAVLWAGLAASVGAPTNLLSSAAGLPGLCFFDDFQRVAETEGEIGSAATTNPVSGEPHTWYTSLASNPDWTYYSISNGALIYHWERRIGTFGCYPTVDLGFKPTRVGARVRWLANGGSGFNQIFFLSYPTPTAYDYGYHIGFSRVHTAPGLWLLTLTNLDWAYYSAPPQLNQPVDIEYRIDDDRLTCYLNGAVVTTVQDPRIRNFGGRYLTVEGYGNVAATDRPEVLSVWASSTNWPGPSLTVLRPNPTTARLRWISRDGYSYRIEQSGDAFNWSPLAGPLFGPVNSTMQFDDKLEGNAVGVMTRFYRLRLE